MKDTDVWYWLSYVSMIVGRPGAAFERFFISTWVANTAFNPGPTPENTENDSSYDI